jgi:hypothetical protein
MRSKLRTTFATAAAAAMVLGTAGLAVASDVDVSVVDVTAPTDAVSIEQGQSAPITIRASVTGNQDGTATFEVYRDWTLVGGMFVGSNPEEFTVAPRTAQDPADTFTTSGQITVDSAQEVGGPFTLAVEAFDITNDNKTGAKLSARGSSNYEVTVLEAASSWDFAGYYSPVDMTGWNTVKGGSTVPLKFNVWENDTRAAELTDVDETVQGFMTRSIDCSETAEDGDEVAGDTTGKTVLRYDGEAGQFIQNWKTPKEPGACYKAVMVLKDGQRITAKFLLK